MLLFSELPAFLISRTIPPFKCLLFLARVIYRSVRLKTHTSRHSAPTSDDDKPESYRLTRPIRRGKPGSQAPRLIPVALVQAIINHKQVKPGELVWADGLEKNSGPFLCIAFSSIYYHVPRCRPSDVFLRSAPPAVHSPNTGALRRIQRIIS